MRIPSSLTAATLSNCAMTPMIDVVFLLLVFFLCASATQVREALLPAHLPPGALAAAVAEQPPPLLGEVLLTVRRQAGQVVVELNGTRFADWRQLEQQLRALAALAPEIPVILDVGPDVDFGSLIRTYDVCRAARFSTIKFAVDLGTTP